jgi:hypothetical protein
MAKDEEELEFISVSPDDDGGENGNMSQSYGVSNATGRGGYDNVVGNWILNQSKVSLKLFGVVSAVFVAKYHFIVHHNAEFDLSLS